MDAHAPTLAAPGPGGMPDRLASGAPAGEYVVDHFLGAGAMGEVYAGRHPVIGKRVAIKVLRGDLAASPQGAERFIREARAASQIDHPNVIDVFGFGRLADGRLYLVMDLVDGASLRHALADGPLELARALDVVDAIAGALDAAHARGVVHRDLKPDNIVISAEGQLFVLDFGLAKLVSAVGGEAPLPATLTGQGTWLGTPGYMAPEQWSADGAGPASDRYALGVIAFELLSGALPFSAPSVPAMMEQHFRAAVPALSARGVALPPAIDDVLRRAMAKDPEARFGSARELADALRAAAGTAVGMVARAVAPPTTATRRLWIPAATGAGVLGVALVAVIATRHTDDPVAPVDDRAGPPAGTVAVDVISTPDHAEVSVGDRLVGRAPTTLHLRPGQTAELAVRMPGYLAAHKTVTAGAAPGVEQLALPEVAGFGGTWRLADGALRAFERAGDHVDVWKLGEVGGARQFYKHYPFVPASDAEIAFAADELVVDPRAPEDPNCHITVRVEYRYRQADDVLELRRPKLTIDLVDGHCVAHHDDVEASRLVRVDATRDAVEILAPAGAPPKRAVVKPGTKRVVPLQPLDTAAPFNAVGKPPTSAYTSTKARPTANLFQDDRAQANVPPQQAPAQIQQQPVQRKD